MHGKAERRTSISSPGTSATAAGLKIALMFALTIVLTQSLRAQTLKVLYNFTSGHDGGVPGSLVIDRAGNLYGTTMDGGDGGFCGSTPCGTVFRLSNNGVGWILTTLHSFTGNPYQDGAVPTGITFGVTGNLYGATEFGGETQQACGGGCGTVFKLGPPASTCRMAPCDWTETVLYRFSGSDGDAPLGNPAFDQSGNLFGVSYFGGAGGCSSGCGLVWELTPSPAGWRESVPYRFNGSDGAAPIAGVTISPSGNLYGTTTAGGHYGSGTVFQLAPSGSGWRLNTLYSFQGASGFPNSLVLDNSGNLYGSTPTGGSHHGGMVFELANGNWMFSELYSFDGPSYPLSGPDGNLVMDSRGNLYGVTEKEGGTGCGGYGCGTVFKLTPGAGGWTYTLLHSFTGGDGSYPSGNLVFDATGNLYGTAEYGGANGRGVVFEITFP